MKTKIITADIKRLAIAYLTVWLLAGCGTDWLEIKPKGRFTEEDLPAGSLEGRVFAAYSGLRSEATSGLPYAAVHNIRSDDAHLGSNSGDYAQAGPIYDEFNYSLSHWLTDSYWDGHYALINLTNNVITALDSIAEPSTGTLVNVAEAKFLRGWAYFNLVRTFGEVPIIDFRITDQASAIRPKSTIDAIYRFIDADIAEAVAMLPEQWDGYPGRATRGAALAVQTKTYMARQLYAQALASAQAIISSGVYDLSVPYHQIFREERENSKESIFEIQALFDGVQDFGVTWASRQGVRGSGEWNLGWGWNIPNQRLIDAFEPNDPRHEATVLYSGKDDGFGNVLPDNLPRAQWNKKAYTDPAIRRQLGNNFGRWFNVRIIRYADIVLLAAEAANELGGDANIDLALDYLEQVRARARGGNSGILPPVTTRNQAELRQAIRHERQVELGMENERFFDLVRWGIDVETMHGAGHVGYQQRNRYFPIPQKEVDRSGGVLIQNPDYQ
ncbi:Starch-binding associating with outer membrane [Parapedobacter composti]|uniref:Starch-binding associating with outer membrane n=1 Tax=Parapedobacter composti TaxID=623281 RepID=A0A1I1IEJ5_9SPHI|nr:RagB/SusD family nutrient uptake outer membrane protein [Parapedobacter composti]SFC34644.1 Starch-binding associating with outer membrane [Parapedobacter composti]